MKYITQVMDGNDTKHIVEVEGKNVEVIHLSKSESYGNKKDTFSFVAKGIKISSDLQFKVDSSYDFTHLAQVVIAIELVRFVTNHLKGESK